MASTDQAASNNFSNASRFFCILGGIAAIFGGLSLAFLKAVGENSLPEAIANGIGWYCIGKGIFMIASPFQLKGAVDLMLNRSKSQPNNSFKQTAPPPLN